MSGICGIALREPGQGQAEDALQSMLEALWREPNRSPTPSARTARGAGFALGGTDGGLPVGIGLAVQGTVSGTVVLIHQGYPILPGDPAAAGLDHDSIAARCLASYLERGVVFVETLRGEAAIAVWDERERALHLIPDRFGIYPLYVRPGPDSIRFGSRLPAVLMGSVGPHPVIDPASVLDVVASSIIPSPRTIFRGIGKIPPGHLLTWRLGQTTTRPYWDITFLSPDNRRESDLAEETRTRLSEAVRLRVPDGVPDDARGSFLSGGIDSTTVAALLARATGRPPRTFSIGFRESAYDEMHYARLASRALRAEHHEHFVSPDEVLDALPTIIRSFDEPFGNASAVPTYLCARLARECGIKVLFAGDGGDELFAGNERYATQRLFDDYFRIPGVLRHLLVEPGVSVLAGVTRWSLARKAQSYIRRAKIPYPARLTSYGFFRTFSPERLFQPDFLETVPPGYEPSTAREEAFRRAPARNLLQKQLYVDLKLTIGDNDLLKVTRMSAAAGVDVRFPFLDVGVAELAGCVPAAYLMRGRELRTFFKRAYADLLPPETLAKKKHGFGLPIAPWIRTHAGLNAHVRDVLFSERTLSRGYYRRAGLEELAQLHQADRTSFYGTAIWNILVLELWLREFAD